MIHVIATLGWPVGRWAASLAEARKVVPDVLAGDGRIEDSPAIDAATDIEARHSSRDSWAGGWTDAPAE
jgi:hypothetical protein